MTRVIRRSRSYRISSTMGTVLHYFPGLCKNRIVDSPRRPIPEEPILNRSGDDIRNA